MSKRDIDVLEEEISDTEETVVGIEYHPSSDLPNDLEQLDGTTVERFNSDNLILFSEIEIDPEEFAEGMEPQSWVENIITEPEDFVDDMRRKIRNEERKMRRKGRF